MMTEGKPYIWAAILTLMFALGAEASSRTFSTIWDYIYSSPDSLTQGVVTRSDFIKIVNRGDRSHFSYYYTVNNKLHFGHRISYGPSYGLNTSPPHVMKKKYPVGKKITVYYDPTKPEYSILEKTTLGFDVYWKIILLLISFPLLSVLLRRYY